MPLETIARRDDVVWWRDGLVVVLGKDVVVGVVWVAYVDGGVYCGLAVARAVRRARRGRRIFILLLMMGFGDG